MRWPIVIAAILASGCVTASDGADEARVQAPSPILHYLRTNRDGSEPEHVVQFRRDDRHIAVYKWVEKCTTAAYVTADFDPAAGEALALDAGKVARDGSQAKFGRIVLDREHRALDLAIDTPEGGHEQLAGVGQPWFLFDYDLADLNAALQTRGHERDFAFYWAVVMPDPDSGELLHSVGWVDARDTGIVRRAGRRARQFDLSLRADPAVQGHVWVDAEDGYIVAADFDRPNHDNYRDFALKLERIEPGSDAAWAALLAGQYAGCPSGEEATD